MTGSGAGSGARFRAPCLIGWAQVSRYPGEPLDAWAESLRATGVPATAIDSLDVVYCQSWPYDDPAGRLAEAVGATPRRATYSGIGGTVPLQLVMAAAERIAAGESEVCAVVGGEALATVRAAKKAGRAPGSGGSGRAPGSGGSGRAPGSGGSGRAPGSGGSGRAPGSGGSGARLPWSHRDPEKQRFPFEAPFHPAEVSHQLFQAYSTFALRDVARRAHLGMDVGDHRRALGDLFSPMTKVAATNPHAWFPQERTADELVEVTADNRMVAFPYTKRLVAVMDVDLSAAVVLASAEAADRLGVPEDERLHLRGWAYATDPVYVAEHDELWRSPAMAWTFAEALAAAGMSLDDVDLADLYSCFPSSVLFALDALDIGSDHRLAPFTVTGGLPYAGGAGSTYLLSSIAAMADQLRSGAGASGLVSGVGMHLTKHAAAVLGTEPGEARIPPPDPGPAVRRPIVDVHHGPATIAAYTVHHGRDGEPSDAVLICDVDGAPDGARCYAAVRDGALLRELEADEWVGRAVELGDGGEGVNVVTARGIRA